MRNKGFFWFLTIILTAVCVYQLSFTFVSNGVESKAAKTADMQLAELQKQYPNPGDSASVNGVNIAINTPEGMEIAKASLINSILKAKADTKVYPLLGSTFSDVKKRSLAFGLDLVGGMSVTMEISIPDLVKSYARSERDAKFKRVFDAADKEYATGGDFVDLFIAKHKAFYPNEELIRLFALTDADGLNAKSKDADVIKFLKDKVASSMDGVEQIMSRRINKFGVSQPNIQKDPANNRLYIELPGVQDEKTVVDQIQASANLEFFETYALSEIQQEWEQANFLSTQDEIDAEALEYDSLGNVIEDTTKVEDVKSLDESIASMNSNQKGLAGLLKSDGYNLGFATAENRDKVDKLLQRDDIKAALPDEFRAMWGADMEKLGGKGELGYVLYAIKTPVTGKARVGGKDIGNAKPGLTEDGKISVNLTMTNEGADKWRLMTAENVGRQVAITMDNVVYSAPVVRGEISGGSTEISGTFTIEDAKQLSGLLNGGALPAPCVIKEQVKVGPTIGADNSRAGLISFGIALCIVFAYMIFYYGRAGIVADISLLTNILLIFGSLASFGAVLTLAGIAGIVLTIGMAVDANVIIFERIREELAAGKDMKLAVDTGFKKSLSSIIDANVTTLLTAVVLKVMGSGPIESFATTLIIGIFTSIFCALVVSRLIINRQLDRNKVINFDTTLTKGRFKNINIDFIGKRKIFYAVSGILLVVSLVGIFTKGLTPNVEFTGGRTYGVKFEKSSDGKLGALEANIRASFGSDGSEASLATKTKSNSYFVEITTNYMLGNDKANNIVLEKLKVAFEKSKGDLGEAKITESRSVSAAISDDLKSSSYIAILASIIIMFGYILMRFGKWQYSIGAILALAHDVAIVLGVFALLSGVLPFNMEVDQAFIAAILTVIGYSINDTVIIYDRIRENLGMSSNRTNAEEINSALNSTLSRTINTSMTTFLVLLSIFLFGGAAIKSFVFALMIGVVVGTYSSICIATPILVDLSKKIKTK